MASQEIEATNEGLHGTSCLRSQTGSAPLDEGEDAGVMSVPLPRVHFRTGDLGYRSLFVALKSRFGDDASMHGGRNGYSNSYLAGD